MSDQMSAYYFLGGDGRISGAAFSPNGTELIQAFPLS